DTLNKSKMISSEGVIALSLVAWQIWKHRNACKRWDPPGANVFAGNLRIRDNAEVLAYRLQKEVANCEEFGLSHNVDLHFTLAEEEERHQNSPSLKEIYSAKGKGH
ncbi:hypothetical protein ACJX0J_005951, partial [Zea mays]